MKKLNSFTIVELMVSLLISGIVISISYYALTFFNRQFTGYRKTSAILNTFRLFGRSMHADFDRSSVIVDSSGGRVMLFDLLKRNKIAEYSFGPDLIVRNAAAATDSFFLNSTIIKIDRISDSLPLIRSLFVNTSIEGSVMGSEFRKDYTGSELMSAEKLFYE